MIDKYVHRPHPRIEQRKAEGPAKVDDQRGARGRNFFVRVNAKLGLKVTMAVGTMWAAYLFTFLALFALPSAIHQGTYFVVVWLSSSFLQLVLLPVIIVGQNIQAAAADKRAEDTFNDADAVLHEAIEIQKHLSAQDEEINRLVVLLEAATKSRD